MSKKSDVKKYFRREFLTKIGYGARVFASGAFYGTLGNISGKVYQTGKNFVGELERDVNKVKEQITKPYEKMSDFFKGLVEKEDKAKYKKPVKKKKQISRRGFLNSLIHFVHEHPITSGTIFRVTYSVRESALKNYDKLVYQLERAEEKLARAKDREIIKEVTKEIELLKEKIEAQTIPRHKKWENKIEAETLLIVGISILVFSIFLNSFETTGYAILRYKVGFITLDAVLFFISLILIFLGIRGR